MLEAQKERFVNATGLEGQFQKKVQSYSGTLAAIAYQSALQTIKEAPTVDAVEVVRCKDCKYYYDRASIFAGRRITLCAKYNQGLSCPKPDDFCSYGERRRKE